VMKQTYWLIACALLIAFDSYAIDKQPPTDSPTDTLVANQASYIRSRAADAPMLTVTTKKWFCFGSGLTPTQHATQAVKFVAERESRVSRLAQTGVTEIRGGKETISQINSLKTKNVIDYWEARLGKVVDRSLEFDPGFGVTSHQVLHNCYTKSDLKKIQQQELALLKKMDAIRAQGTAK